MLGCSRQSSYPRASRQSSCSSSLVVLGNLVTLEFLGNLVILAFLVVLSNLGHLVVFMVSRHSCLTAHPRLLLYSLYNLLLTYKKFFQRH